MRESEGFGSLRGKSNLFTEQSKGLYKTPLYFCALFPRSVSLSSLRTQRPYAGVAPSPRPQPLGPLYFELLPKQPRRIYILSVLFSGNSYTNGAKAMAMRMSFSTEREILQT